VIKVYRWYTEGSHDQENGGAYYVERDLDSVGAVRIHARQAPDKDDLKIDIKADGVSIFETIEYIKENFVYGETSTFEKPTYTTGITLVKGENKEDSAENFDSGVFPIKAGAWLTMEIESNGAKGITVQLELVSGTEDNEVEY